MEKDVLIYNSRPGHGLFVKTKQKQDIPKINKQNPSLTDITLLTTENRAYRKLNIEHERLLSDMSVELEILKDENNHLIKNKEKLDSINKRQYIEICNLKEKYENSTREYKEIIDSYQIQIKSLKEEMESREKEWETTVESILQRDHHQLVLDHRDVGSGGGDSFRTEDRSCGTFNSYIVYPDKCI